MEKKKNTRLKDVFNNCEYLTIKRNNKQVLYLDDKEINGMTRTDLAKLIGEKIGEGVYHYTVKYYNDPKISVGKITSIIKPGVNVPAAPDNSEFFAKISQLERKIESTNNLGADFSTIMQMKDAAFKIQIDFYKSQVDQLKAENERLKKEVNDGGNNPLMEALAPVLLQLLTKQPAA